MGQVETRNRRARVPRVAKAATGIAGFDELTEGGLPKGRTTLVCGGPGSGKTLFGIEFLVRGAERGEPGVLVSFEETREELAQNVASLGFDLPALEREGKLLVDHIEVSREQMEETGEYDLEGLFVRLGYAIDSIGAKRVVIDSIESLFGALSNEYVLRAEIRRLFGWLKAHNLTAIATGERGGGTLTRHGLEEYVSDCVLLLDNTVHDRIATRLLRVVKYRGSRHGGDEYPFVITSQGFSVLPVTSLGLRHKVSSRRVSTGVRRLDTMLGGGYFCGSSVLVSGPSGSGKSTLAASFVDAACKRGVRCLYLAFEESPAQITRNMRSVGIDLDHWVRQGVLRIEARRPSAYGFEAHLDAMHAQVNEFDPKIVVADPLSAFHGSEHELVSMLARLINFLKARGTTSLFTSLVREDPEQSVVSEVGISSVIDTWIALRNVYSNGERNRLIDVIKSRGMAHSNQVREFVISGSGIDLLDVYTGLDGMVLGTARVARESERRTAELRGKEEAERHRRSFEHRRAAIEAQIADLQAQLEFESLEAEREGAESERQFAGDSLARADIALRRQADTPTNGRRRLRGR